MEEGGWRQRWDDDQIQFKSLRVAMRCGHSNTGSVLIPFFIIRWAYLPLSVLPSYERLAGCEEVVEDERGVDNDTVRV
jgi:hypothetical protein